MFTKVFFISIFAWFAIFGSLTVLVFVDHSNYKYLKQRQDTSNKIMEDGLVKHIKQEQQEQQAEKAK